MLTAARLVELIGLSFTAHDLHSKDPHHRFRKFDGKTPYGVHPAWCALSILSEGKLPEELRVLGAQVLLFHDVKEDTTASLPTDCDPRVPQFVDEMTFENSEDEIANVWSRSRETILFKLYDKTHNRLNLSTTLPKNRKRYGEHILRLAVVTEENYGPLSIITMARALIAAHPS